MYQSWLAGVVYALGTERVQPHPTNHHCLPPSNVTLKTRNSLAVQWLGLRAFTAGVTGSIPGQGTKIPHAAQPSQKERKKERQTDRLRGEDAHLRGLFSMGM